MKLIDIGGQKNRGDLDGKWEIIDIRAGAEIIVDLNTCSDLQVPHDSMDAYYTSHTLEHLTPERVKKVLREMYLTLKPGGKVRIVVPDIFVGIDWYLHFPEKLRSKDAPTKPEGYPNTPLGYLLSWVLTPDKGVINGHKMAFDWATLYTYLKGAGFIHIKNLKYCICSEIFIGKDLPRYTEYSLYVETAK